MEKLGSLVLLVAQNASLSLLMKSASVDGALLFTTAAVVFASECVKLLACVVALVVRNGGIGSAWRAAHHGVAGDALARATTLRMALPALLFTLQTNLLWMGIARLPAPVFMISAQLKVVTTAVAAVLMLGMHLSRTKKAALLLLQLGVILVHASRLQSSSSSESSATPSVDVFAWLTGVVCVLASCTSSAVSSVYFEKMLKTGSKDVWIRNIQLGLFALPLTAMQLLFMGSGGELGFFRGFEHRIVQAIVLDTALGGIAVSLVIKYADNVVKCFATSLSLIIGSVASVFLFDFTLTPLFIVGAAFVITSIFTYNREETVAVAVREK